MADEKSGRDVNSITTLIGETAKGEIRKIRTTDVGILLTDIGATITGMQGDALKVADENTLILKQILVEQKITNKILNEVHGLYVNEEDLK